MKKLYEQDLILKNILNNTELVNAPTSMKAGILTEISGLSIPAKQAFRLPGLSILITVALILLFCMAWAVTSATGLEWSLPGINEISFQPDLDKWLKQAGILFDSLFDISLNSKGKWTYYLGGGLILFWFYFLVNKVLDKLTHSKQNYSV